MNSGIMIIKVQGGYYRYGSTYRESTTSKAEYQIFRIIEVTSIEDGILSGKAEYLADFPVRPDKNREPIKIDWIAKQFD